MNPDLQRMEQALQNAANAGDVEAARQIASEMRSLMLRDNPRVGEPEDLSVASAKLAAEGVGMGEAALIAAGRGFDKLGAGIEQIGQAARTAPRAGMQLPAEKVQAGQEGLERLSQEQSAKDVAFAPLQKAHPFSTALGEAAPYAALPASMGTLPMSLAVGGMEAMKYGTPQERLVRGGLGAGSAAIGGMVGKTAGKIMSPVGDDVMNATRREALVAGLRQGVKPRLSEVTGSKFLERMEDMAARTPGGAGVMDDFARGNTQAFNRAAARTIGEQADELSPSVLASASDRLGKVFESVKSLPGKSIRITQDVANTADDILRIQNKMIPAGHAGGIAGQQDHQLVQLAQQAKALAANKGRIDGETYQLIRSGLSQASFDADGANKVLYGRLLESLDNAAEQSLQSSGQADLAAALRSARPQYGNLKTLEKGLVAEGGNVSPARLAQVLRQKNPGAFREGRMAGNELYDIAKYGESFKPLRAGSPTYEREVSGDLLSLALKSPLAYGTAKATTSPMMTAYPTMLATNPKAALTAKQLAALLNSTARGATMGAANAALPKVAE